LENPKGELQVLFAEARLAAEDISGGVGLGKQGHGALPDKSRRQAFVFTQLRGVQAALTQAA
jgi:hypothetical protein